MEKSKLFKPCPSCPAHVLACGVCAAHMVMGLQLHKKYCSFFCLRTKCFSGWQGHVPRPASAMELLHVFCCGWVVLWKILHMVLGIFLVVGAF
jgi:hypothetical protein